MPPSGLGAGHVGPPGRRPGSGPLGGLPPAGPHRWGVGGHPVADDRDAVHRPERFDPAEVQRQAAVGASLVSLVATALVRTDTSGYRAVLLGGPPHPRTWRQRGDHLRDDRDRLGDRLRRPGHRRRRAAHRRRTGGAASARCWCGGHASANYRDGTDPRLPDGWFPTGDAGLSARRHGHHLRAHGRGHRQRGGEGVARRGGAGAGRSSRRGPGGGLETGRPRVG